MKYLIVFLISMSAFASPESEFMSGCTKGLAKRFPTEKEKDHIPFCTVTLDHARGELGNQKNPTHFGCWKAIEQIAEFYGQDYRTQYKVNCL